MPRLFGELISRLLKKVITINVNAFFVYAEGSVSLFHATMMSVDVM